MERLERMLYESAVKGSVNTLLKLLHEDSLILDNLVAMYSLSESPLHVAASLGHVDFVKEILRRKPQLAGELDWQRSSALHKASHKGYADIVHALLQVNPDMCFARDADGRNPLHLAAMGGWIDVLEELVRARPLAVSATTIWGETILHLCLKHNQLEALKFLLEKMDDQVQELLNAKNDFGMTILHLAVADKQIAVIEFLTTRKTLKVNALSTKCFTALDILAQSKRDVKDSEIWELLRRAGAIRAKDIQLSANEPNITEGNSNSLASHDNSQKQQLQGKGLENVPKKEDWLEKKRNALMVVASLIATMAFQAALAPPHSPQQDTCSQDDGSTTLPNQPRQRFIPSPKYKNFHPYADFLVYNTTGFLASLSIILLLISGIPLKRNIFMWILMVIMWVAITAMAMTYMVSIDYLADPNRFGDRYSTTSSIVIIVWIGVGVILILGHSTRLMVKMANYIKKSFRRLRSIQVQDEPNPQ